MVSGSTHAMVWSQKDLTIEETAALSIGCYTAMRTVHTLRTWGAVGNVTPLLRLHVREGFKSNKTKKLLRLRKPSTEAEVTRSRLEGHSTPQSRQTRGATAAIWVRGESLSIRL